MADRLTQLQDCLDDLLIQMFAALNYIQTRYPYGEIEGQPSQAPQADNDLGGPDPTQSRTVPIMINGNAQSTTAETITPGPDSQETFRAALRELAQDLVMQEQKTEILINSLPGLGTSERDQRKRMEDLRDELQEVKAERQRAEQDKVEMLQNLDRLLLSLGRGR